MITRYDEKIETTVRECENRKLIYLMPRQNEVEPFQIWKNLMQLLRNLYFLILV